MKISFLGFALCVALVRGQSERCYGELGCFSNAPPFDDRDLPMSPGEINLRFEIYTRMNRDNPERITADNPGSHFDARRRTMFIIHGYLTDTSFDWIRNMRNALLDNGDYNVIKVDWEDGASPDIPLWDYPAAASNARVVGAGGAHMVSKYAQTLGLNLAQVHCIGHSLGAQTCGYFGEWLRDRGQTLGRISGLDPAGPWFRGTGPRVRLTSSDATYVDVIHSNGRDAIYMLGIGTPSGHVDFYPNGGGAQPGCIISRDETKDKRQTDIDTWVACSHARAYQYFTESINSVCPFTANPCPNIDDGEDGRCESCRAGETCQQMGWNSISHRGTGRYYIETRDTEPFCRG